MLDTLTADTLSDTLMRMKLKSLVPVAFDAGGKWAIDFPATDAFKLYILLKGEGWISVAGYSEVHSIKAGDCVLLTSARSFVVTNDRSVKQNIPADRVYGTAQNGITTWNGGGDFFTIGTYFQFDGHLPAIVFGNLPPVIHIPSYRSEAAILHRSLEQFSAEFRGNNPGRSLMLNHLAPIMLLQILRVYLASTKKEHNWLMALSDPKLSGAIEAMHSHYERPWSLEELAKVACMSRSGFALHFKKQVGVAPMDYLTNWRMQAACELLQAGDRTIATVANAVGYESESAFSLAFKKVIKCRPGFYQKSHTGLLPP